MTRLFIIRHGETEWNRQNRTQGCSYDLSLSDKGRLQSEAIAERFKSIQVDAIYSSDLKRAVETAAKISQAVSIPIKTSPGLREMNFGCWEGMTHNEIKQKYAYIYEIWRNTPAKAVISGGETLVMLQKRAMDAINDIINSHKGKNIVIVSHGITIKIIISSIMGMDISCYNRIRLDNTGMSIIDYMENSPILILFNDICHLSGRFIV